MPAAWASCGDGEAHLPAGEFDRAAIRRLGAREDFQQRRFARAVLAKKSVDLGRADFEVDVFERVHAGKRLG